MNDQQLARARQLVAELTVLLNGPVNLSIPSIPPPPPEEITVSGRVARPEYSTPNGKPLWKAGIGVDTDNGIEWVNAVAWGELAKQGQQFQRGDIVNVAGKFHENNYTDKNGTPHSSRQFVVSRFL